MKSWFCPSTNPAASNGLHGGCLASIFCCCYPSTSDKERRTNAPSHLEKCQSFYTGLSQNGPMGPGGLLQANSLHGVHGGHHGVYPTASAGGTTGGCKKSRTLGGSNGLLTSGLIGSAHTTTRVIKDFFLSLFCKVFYVGKKFMEQEL